MLRKLLIRTWFGPLPKWTTEWRRNTESLADYGYDFLLLNDYSAVALLAEKNLGIQIAPYEQIQGTRKAGDFDPTYGELLAHLLVEYDFWGHCALDAVYGRLDRFVTDELLDGCDVFSNDPGAICGPFTLYRNCAKVNSLFRRVPSWESLLSSPTMHGFDEIQFNEAVNAAAWNGEIRFETRFWQSHDTQEGHNPTPQLEMFQDGTLVDGVTGKETMMFHFHRYRKWPINASS